MFKDGKLFGKLNVIDLLVIIIAVAVVAAVALKLTGKTARQGQEAAGVDVVYTVKASGIEPQVAKSIQEFITTAQTQGKPGDQLMSGGHMVDAYVTQVESAPSQSNLFLTWGENGQAVASAGERVDLTFTIVGKAEDATSTLVGTQEVRVGRPHIVKTTHFELMNGVVLTCQWKNAA